MEILQLVDQLEQVLNRGYRLPLSASLVVSEEECLRLIDQMRISVPSAIKESERMVAERDRILGDARKQAADIVEQARQQALEMVNQDYVAQEARREADRILDQSRQEAERMVLRSRDEASALIQDAEEYTIDVLQQLVDRLSGVTQQARNGIRAIQQSREPDMQAAAPETPSTEGKPRS